MGADQYDAPPGPRPMCKDCVLFVPSTTGNAKGDCHLNPPDTNGYNKVDPETDWCGFLR